VRLLRKARGRYVQVLRKSGLLAAFSQINGNLRKMRRRQENRIMLNRTSIFGIIAIMAVVLALALAFSLPSEATENCQSGDNTCPKGCTYANDPDCLHSTTTTGGEIRRCLSDSECAVVNAICGNEKCNFNDASCEKSCSCGVAVNKDYQSVFESASVNCIQSEPLACYPCPINSTAVCISGECRIVT